MTNPAGTIPDEVSDHAKKLAQEASAAASGVTAEAKAIARDSAETLEERLDDTKELVAEAADSVRGLRADLADLAKETSQVVGAYAKQVADVAAEKFAAAKGTVVSSRGLCEDYVKREPVKAALIAAAVGAIATKLLLIALTSKAGQRQQQGDLPYR